MSRATPTRAAAASPIKSTTKAAPAAARAASAAGARPKAHAAQQHAKFLEQVPPPRTATLQDPFSVYLHKLAKLSESAEQARLESHHVVVDSVRILEDVLVHAAQTFLSHRTPPPLLALTVEHAQTGVVERLRDAEVISPWINRQIDDARKLARWVLVSSAREVPRETAANILVLVTRLAEQFLSHVQCAAEQKPHSGCTAKHAFCRDMAPAHLSVIGGAHDAHKIPPNVPKGGAAAAAAAAGSPSAADPSATPFSPTNAERAAKGGLANPNGKSLKPAPRAHGALPYGWDVATFEAHCAPLHNTAHLDLAALEAEEEAAEAEELAAREAERAEKVRLREEAAERRRERREAEEARRAGAKADADGELSGVDENPEEVDSEEERLTARRAAAREAAGEGAASESESEDGEDDEDESDDEDGLKKAAKAERKAARAERKAAEAADEALANSAVPARVAPAKTRFVFTFCCIVCHSVLLRGRDVDRVVANQVWSKAGRNLAAPGKSLLKNFADNWASRPADEREPKKAGAEDDEEEPEPEPADDDEEAGADAPPKDEGAARREESVGVHCAGCDVYVGRFFPVRDSYRLVYIQRSSGQNFMYFTGDTSTGRLRPLLVRKSEEEEEAEAERLAREEEQGSDEEEQAFLERRAAQTAARASMPVPPVVGLPFEYVDERQAARFPFPRFGPGTPYNQPSSWQLMHTSLLDSAAAAALLAQAAPKAAEESKENASGLSSPLSSTSKLGFTGVIASKPSKSSVKCNSKTFRPLVPPVPTVHRMLRRTPDTHYALPPAAAAAADPAQAQMVTADLSVLLWTDRVFHNRRAMDQVSTRVANLLASTFPAGSPYANTLTPPVPVFTHFFASPKDLTHCRGTARYVFHFLTHKDDSKLKRVAYSYKKLLKSLARYEHSVHHLSAGGYGGHRFVLVKVGAAYRLFQSNHNLDRPADRYTCAQWIASDYPWSRILDHAELLAFLAKFEEARRGRKDAWEQLFTCGQKAQVLYDVSDEWQPDQVVFACAKLQDFSIQY